MTTSTSTYTVTKPRTREMKTLVKFRKGDYDNWGENGNIYIDISKVECIDCLNNEEIIGVSTSGGKYETIVFDEKDFLRLLLEVEMFADENGSYSISVLIIEDPLDFLIQKEREYAFKTVLSNNQLLNAYRRNSGEINLEEERASLLKGNEISVDVLELIIENLKNLENYREQSRYVMEWGLPKKSDNRIIKLYDEKKVENASIGMNNIFYIEDKFAKTTIVFHVGDMQHIGQQLYFEKKRLIDNFKNKTE